VTTNSLLTLDLMRFKSTPFRTLLRREPLVFGRRLTGCLFYFFLSSTCGAPLAKVRAGERAAAVLDEFLIVQRSQGRRFTF
jgi:hypothetical protein